MKDEKGSRRQKACAVDNLIFSALKMSSGGGPRAQQAVPLQIKSHVMAL
jgi:hypothetical protein